MLAVLIDFVCLVFIFQICLLKNVLRVTALVVGISVLGEEYQSWRFFCQQDVKAEGNNNDWG